MKGKRINYFKYFSLFFTIAVLVFITGCNGTPPAVPIINSFSADPSSITAGESSTLSWSVTDATSVTIDNGVGTVALSGTTTVSPITTIIYTLTATNSAGSVTASVTVTVGATPITPVINSFLANPSTITVGESSTLSWSVTDAASVTIDNAIGSVALTGATAVNPTTTTTYILTATNVAGSVTATTTVTVSSALTITYNGNGNTGGTIPVDSSSPYEYGVTVTVLGNTGGLTRINDGGTSYYFTSWNTKADGSGADQTEGSTFTMGASNVTLYAQWAPYVLLGTGPAGGYIFYDKGNYSYGWRYLEAAPSDQSTSAPWGCYGVSISGADGTVVGTGEQNTIDIEAGCATFGTAADICANLGLGGYSDWFLPSKDELHLMYANLKVAGVGGFAGSYYWSSSEYDAGNAWGQYFNGGGQFNYYKFSTYRVRAVRAF